MTADDDTDSELDSRIAHSASSRKPGKPETSEVVCSGWNGNPRFFTPRECARLQGFPDNYAVDGTTKSEFRIYYQLGFSCSRNPTILFLMHGYSDFIG